MGLGAAKNASQDGLTVDMDQWMVEPTISYRVSKYFEPLADVSFLTRAAMASLRGSKRGINENLTSASPAANFTPTSD